MQTKREIYEHFDKTETEDFHKRDFRLDNKSGSSSLRLLLLFVLYVCRCFSFFHCALRLSCSDIYLIWSLQIGRRKSRFFQPPQQIIIIRIMKEIIEWLVSWLRQTSRHSAFKKASPDRTEHCCLFNATQHTNQK